MTLVAITYNLKKKPAEGLPEDFYSEFDEKSTISAIESAIRKAGFKTARIEADEKAYIKLKKMRPDFVFNIAEGLRGRSRESQIPAMLELLEIPYLASDPTTLSIGLNKAMTKDPKAPTPAASVGVTMPRYSPPMTMKMRTRMPHVPERDLIFTFHVVDSPRGPISGLTLHWT